MQAQEAASDQPQVSRGWIVAFVIAIVGVAAGWFGPIQILLPAQSGALADAGWSKEAILALVTGVGAAASLVANPLWGAISDRTRSRWGRRRPILVAGALLGVVGFVVLAAAPSVVWMLVGWIAVQVGLNGPFAALAATIADRVPEHQRGLVGSLFGVAQTVGVVFGTALAVALGEGSLGYVALAIAVPALSIAFLIVHKEPSTDSADAGVASQHVSPNVRAFFSGLRPTRLFVWAWVIRLLMNLANALVLLYLYFYLSDGVGVDAPGDWVLIVTLVSVLVTAAVASVAGPLSDRRKRRLPFLVMATIIGTAGALLMAFVPVLEVVVVAAGLVGVGWGLYIAVDLAIITSALSDDATHGTMLGVANIASSLPQVIAPAVAAPIVLNLGGYPALYVTSAIVCAVALLLVPQLRPMR